MSSSLNRRVEKACPDSFGFAPFDKLRTSFEQSLLPLDGVPRGSGPVGMMKVYMFQQSLSMSGVRGREMKYKGN